MIRIPGEEKWILARVKECVGCGKGSSLGVSLDDQITITCGIGICKKCLDNPKNGFMPSLGIGLEKVLKKLNPIELLELEGD